MKKFNIGVDDGWNGVYLPATTKSPNPTGSLVHSTLHTNEYYNKIIFLLQGAKTQGEAIAKLKRIRETLIDGTFHHANL